MGPLQADNADPPEPPLDHEVLVWGHPVRTRRDELGVRQRDATVRETLQVRLVERGLEGSQRVEEGRGFGGQTRPGEELLRTVAVSRKSHQRVLPCANLGLSKGLIKEGLSLIH